MFCTIANPAWRQILALLRSARHSVGDLAANFGTSRPAISKHLRLLRSAGLVVTHQHGAARICELNAKPLRAINDWLREYEELWSASLRDLKRYVEKGR